MAGPVVPQMLSRRRPPPTGDEEAGNDLKLGEMENSSSLSVSEANILLQAIDMQRKRDGIESQNKDIYNKAKDYVSIFARFKESKTVEQIERETRDVANIHHFERAQLATLCCDDADEARTLIPSLEGKMSDEDLQTLLNSIGKLRDFT